MINELRNLNDIQRATRRGIYKQRLARDSSEYIKIEEYMQKINFCIQDLNTELNNLNSLEMRSIVYITVLTDWLIEAVEKLEKSYAEGIFDEFNYAKEADLKKAKNYLLAIRAFMVAHPLSTNRHKDYGFDGNLICIDIRLPNKALHLVPENCFYQLSHEGQVVGKDETTDFFLYAYSRKTEHKVTSVYIGCKLQDIYKVTELYIEKLYAMDKYLISKKVSR